MKHYHTSFFCGENVSLRIHTKLHPGTPDYPAIVTINASSSFYDTPRVTIYMSESQLADFINSLKKSFTTKEEDEFY